MLATQIKTKLTTVRRILITFVIFLILSGITAFPVRTEIHFLVSIKDYFPPLIQNWIEQLNQSIKITPDIMLYGTDWLAFAHIVIAIAFIGPIKDPVKNSWVIQFGMIACLMVLPLAFICGPLRGIPLFHQLIDCSFGIIGFIPLYYCYKKIKSLENNQ